MPTISPVSRGGGLPERLRAMVNEMVASLTAAGQPYPEGKVLTAQGVGETPTWETVGAGVPVQAEPPEAVKGGMYYDTDDDHLYLCTSAT